MKTYFKDGKTVCDAQAYENVMYDVANNGISVRFDGKGCVTRYSVLNEGTHELAGAALKIFIDGRELPFDAEKTVEMYGRIQTVSYTSDVAEIKIKSFLHRDRPCAFTRISLKSRGAVRVKIAFYMRGAADCALTAADGFTGDYSNGFRFASDRRFSCLPDNESVVFDETETVGQAEYRIAYAFSDKPASGLLKDFDLYESECDREFLDVDIPVSAATEEQKAQYCSAFFCALENFKEIGDFRAFTAGCRYVSPVRTYYRDSYFTVLAMYNGHTDKVRDQIAALSRGIGDDGSCPSAVLCDFSSWWSDHYDSPSFYCMMVYDYVNNTGDLSLLDEKWGGTTVCEKAEKVVNKLSRTCDGSGLSVKCGRFNRRDWADEVNRYGYVAYDEILYARALFCLHKLLAAKGCPRAENYLAEYGRVCKAINEILWDDAAGYYVNYKNDDFTESNLSIDTVLAAVFGIAPEERAVRMLRRARQLLESRNSMPVDFGVMCVYPPYSRIDAAVNKSSRPFDYHNGADWPYWSAMYAYALKMYGMDWSYPLTRWFKYNTERGSFTPVEYFSPYCATGSTLQAWSSAAAFVYYDADCSFFKNKL